jgi:hypothetical protein
VLPGWVTELSQVRHEAVTGPALQRRPVKAVPRHPRQTRDELRRASASDAERRQLCDRLERLAVVRLRAAAAAAAAAEHDPPPHEHLAALRRPGIEAAARQISKREEGEERGGGDKGLTGKELIPFLPCSPSLRASREGRRDALRMALSYGRLLPPRSRRPILAYDIHLTGLV